MTEEAQTQAFIDSLQQDEVSKQAIASKLRSAGLSSAQASEELATNTTSELQSKKLEEAEKKRSKLCAEIRPCLGPLTILLLLVLNPVGLLIMWMVTPWPKLIKSIITVISILLTLFLIWELLLFISWL